MADALKTDASTHFEFGKNWARYGDTITEEDIEISQKRLGEFLGLDSLDGQTFLDIGCGSGIHTLAALRMGAEKVRAVDIDRQAVETAMAVLARHWKDRDRVTVEEANIFNMSPANLGQFDIVYSWGVLHHTGDMWEAIKKATSFVAPGGIFAIAIYRKTKWCDFWRWEKEKYTRGGPIYRGFAIGALVFARAVRDLLRLRNPFKMGKGHNRKRGMKWHTDIIDWVGGYPYESASADEIRAFLEPLGFRLEYSDKTEQKKSGLLGSGNAEYRFRKI